MPRILFWFRYLHDTWVADGTHQTSTWPPCAVSRYSDISANEDNSFLNHIR